MPQGGILSDPAADLVTVHAGHHDIEQDYVRAELREYLEGIPAALSSAQVVVILERLYNNLDIRNVVVDNE